MALNGHTKCMSHLIVMLMLFFDSHLRYVNYKCLQFQNKNTDHFLETSCQILPPNSRGKRQKWVKWRHQFQVLQVNHFHQVSWLWELTCHVNPQFERKLKFWPPCLVFFFSLNKLAWCFCFKLNYVQRVLTLGKGQYLDILQNMSRCSHLKCEVLSNSEFLLKFVHIVTLCSYLKGQLSSLRNLDF